LYWFCTQTIRADAAALRHCAAVTLLRPMWRISPWRCRLGQHGKGSSMEPSAGPWTSNMDAQVHDLQHVQAEIAQVVVHADRSAPRARSRQPGALFVAPGADLGDDGQVVG
jgi:hypothetical protein